MIHSHSHDLPARQALRRLKSDRFVARSADETLRFLAGRKRPERSSRVP
jgi:hypothetical protein